MGMCWAPDCKHYSERGTCTKFFTIPKNPTTRKSWLNLLRRKETPSASARICSCHFPNGDKSLGPVLFEHNQSKRFNFTSPEKLKRKRSSSTPASREQSLPSSREDSPFYSESDEIVDPLTLPSASREDSPLNRERDEIIDPSTLPSTSQNILRPSRTQLECENYFLRKEGEQSNVGFKYDNIKDDNEAIIMYTGLPNNEIFMAVFNLIKDQQINYYYGWNVEKINKIDQLLMCLMKLRQNFPHKDLAIRFRVSIATVSNVIITMIHVLHELLFKQFMSSIPSRNKNKTCLPSAFSTFTNCRIILDCTELATICSKQMNVQKATFSYYKHKNTWKALIGVAPNGVITFVSQLYAGSSSDKKVTAHCGVLSHLSAGDLILADKGFLLKDILPQGVYLNIPPFLTTPQFTPEQVRQTEKIARARVHVERAIQRMKNYKILSFIPHTLLRHASKIAQLVGALTNLQSPIIKEVEEHFSSDSEISDA